MDEMLQDFLIEAGELLADVDVKLVELEKQPGDAKLLNDIFRGFHTIKGGAGFLDLPMMVDLCHLTENLFDLLRRNERVVNAPMMDAILAATAAVRAMFDDIGRGARPRAAEPALLARLRAVVAEKTLAQTAAAPTHAVALVEVPPAVVVGAEPDWNAFYTALTQKLPEAAPRSSNKPYGRRASDNPAYEEVPVGRRTTDRLAISRDATIRVDTSRLDQVLTLSGELGLAKNRLNCLKNDIVSGNRDPEVLREFEEAVNRLDLVVGDVQRAVMKTRMQPIGRLFHKYPRMARDLARALGKDVELVLEGEGTELDRALIDDLGDPLIHLIRNAIDHGVESPEARLAAGKTPSSTVRLSARQEGDHIEITVRDDGRGMNPEALRRKACEKGLMDADEVDRLDAAQCLELVFLPGFSTKEEVSSISGRGVGMDVVKTGIEKLNGRIEIESETGIGTTFRISLPLTLAVLPVLIVRHGKQPFAVPLSMVHEIMPLEAAQLQPFAGSATIVVRGRVLAVRSLGALLGWSSAQRPRYGVLMKCGHTTFVLAVDDYVGREDVVIKPLTEIRPTGVSGATLAGDGSVVLVLDLEPLLQAAALESVSAFA
jgi:two-component system chemotaxis sensor kinase CheA